MAVKKNKWKRVKQEEEKEGKMVKWAGFRIVVPGFLYWFQPLEALWPDENDLTYPVFRKLQEGYFALKQHN